MSFVLRQTTQLELSQEDEAASGGLGITSALTANRSGSYESTTSPSIARSLSTSPDELLDSPPPSDHRRSSITGTKQQQHFICSSTTNRGVTLAASNSTITRSIIRIQVWLSGRFCVKKETKQWHADWVVGVDEKRNGIWIDDGTAGLLYSLLAVAFSFDWIHHWCCLNRFAIGIMQVTRMSTYQRSRQMCQI